MTSPTHDKEWILDGTLMNEITGVKDFAYTKNEQDFHVLIPETLFDQLRRDAKKELLDEMQKELWSKSNVIAYTRFQQFRAKTLGEQVKKNGN